MSVENYFYYQSLKKIITVFGAMFKEIYTARNLSSGELANVQRVPISYAPRAKFLTRINEDNPNISVELPRMSFEISAIEYDTQSQINRYNKRSFTDQGDEYDFAYSPVTYNVTIELNIYGRTQSDMFQIIEQILPVFTPDYIVSIKNLEGPGTVTDTPFILNDVSMSDEYEGEFNPTRALVYTLNFTTKVKLLGKIKRRAIIKKVHAAIRDMEFFDSPESDEGLYETVIERVDEPTSFISEIDPEDSYVITLDTPSNSYVAGENVFGTSSSYGALVKSKTDNTVTVTHLENNLVVGENLVGEISNESYEILSIEKQ